MEQVITQLADKILFDDYSSFFYEMRRTIIFIREAEKLIDIVYDLDKDQFGLEYLH